MLSSNVNIRVRLYVVIRMKNIVTFLVNMSLLSCMVIFRVHTILHEILVQFNIDRVSITLYIYMFICL